MCLKVEKQKHLRPVHQCKRVGCDNRIYGPTHHREAIDFKTYNCDECGEQYSWWKSEWPNYDVRFIIS